MNRSDRQKKRMREKRRGIGFETVAGMGGLNARRESARHSHYSNLTVRSSLEECYSIPRPEF